LGIKAEDYFIKSEEFASLQVFEIVDSSYMKGADFVLHECHTLMVSKFNFYWHRKIKLIYPKSTSKLDHFNATAGIKDAVLMGVVKRTDEVTY